MKTAKIANVFRHQKPTMTQKVRLKTTALIAAGALMLSSPALKAQEPQKDEVNISKPEAVEYKPMSKCKEILINGIAYVVATSLMLLFVSGMVKAVDVLVDRFCQNNKPDDNDIYPSDF